MKLLPWLLLIIGAGLVYVFWPEPKEPDYSLHEARIAQREQAYHSLSRDYQKLLLKIESDSVSHKIEVQAYKDRDKIKSREIARIKASKVVVQVRDSVPEIDSLIVAYHSLLESKDQQILLSEKYVSTLQIDIGELTANFEERLQLQSETIEDLNTIVDDQRKTIRKERRAKRLAKILVPVVGIATFFLGAQL